MVKSSRPEEVGAPQATGGAGPPRHDVHGLDERRRSPHAEGRHHATSGAARGVERDPCPDRQPRAVDAVANDHAGDAPLFANRLDGIDVVGEHGARLRRGNRDREASAARHAPCDSPTRPRATPPRAGARRCRAPRDRRPTRRGPAAGAASRSTPRIAVGREARVGKQARAQHQRVLAARAVGFNRESLRRDEVRRDARPRPPLAHRFAQPREVADCR